MNQKLGSGKTLNQRERHRRRFLKTSASVAGVALLGDVLRATSLSAATKDEPNLKEVQLLFVQNARDVVMAKDRLTLIGINPTTITFKGVTNA